MIPPEDVLAGLPLPFDDEPPSVRQDIADELADHLACAYRRELLKTADERTAWQRVLDRFGNPQRIAYQLWFQALWGRIMLNRFARVWQGVKVIVGLAVVFLVFRMAEQQSALHNQLQFMTASYNSMQSQSMGNRMLLEQLLSRLPSPPQPTEGAGMSGAMGMGAGAMGGESGMGMMLPGMAGGDMAAAGGPLPSGHTSTAAHTGLTLRLTMEGEDNKPAAGCVVAVANEEGKSLLAQFPEFEAGMMSGGMAGEMGMMPGGPAWNARPLRQNNEITGVSLPPGARGEVTFPAIEPGRYTVYVEFEDGRQCAHRIVIPPGSKSLPRVEHIQCPMPDTKAYVVFHTPLVEKTYADANVRVRASLIRKPTHLGKIEWADGLDSKTWYVYFDPTTGAPIKYDTSQRRTTPAKSSNIINQQFDVSDLPPEERFLGLPAGDYHVSLMWVQPDREPIATARFAPLLSNPFAAEGAAKNGILTIDASTRDILLDFPDGAFEQLKKHLAIETPSTNSEAVQTKGEEPSSTPR